MRLLFPVDFFSLAFLSLTQEKDIVVGGYNEDTNLIKVNSFFMFLDCGMLLYFKNFQESIWFELYQEQKFTCLLIYRCNKIALMMSMK